MPAFHVFCPTFQDSIGTFEMQHVQAEYAAELLGKAILNAETHLHWRHHYKSVRVMLELLCNVRIPSKLDRKTNQSFKPMSNGDNALWLKKVSRSDLRNEVQVADFDFVLVKRIK